MNVEYSGLFEKRFRKINKSDKQVARQIIEKLVEIGRVLCDSEHPYKILDNVGLTRLTASKLVEKNIPAYRIRVGKYRVLVTIEWDRNSILAQELGKRSRVFDTQ